MVRASPIASMIHTENLVGLCEQIMNVCHKCGRMEWLDREIRRLFHPEVGTRVRRCEEEKKLISLCV